MLWLLFVLSLVFELLGLAAFFAEAVWHDYLSTVLGYVGSDAGHVIGEYLFFKVMLLNFAYWLIVGLVLVLNMFH